MRPMQPGSAGADDVLGADLPTAPVGAIGKPLSGDDAVAQQTLFGQWVPGGDDAIALRDARGARFQRLEWLGDSVFDLIAGDHAVRVQLMPDTSRCCAGDPLRTDDRALAVLAHRSGLLTIPDWAPGAERSADLVEAVIGAVFRRHGWAGAVHVAAVLHDGIASRSPLQPSDLLDPVGDATAPGRERRRGPGTDRSSGAAGVSPRELRQLGAQVFDAAASIGIFGALPQADPAGLSAARAAAITNERRAHIADVHGYRRPASRTVVAAADDLDEVLGTACIHRGIEAAVTDAASLAHAPVPATLHP